MSRFSAWRRYRVSAKGTLDFRIPWLVFGCISYLDHWLKKEMLVYEYGSGGSTLYFAGKTRSVVSVEHNPEWYSYAQEAIGNSEIHNIEYKLIEPQPSAGASVNQCTDPANYISCFTDYKGYAFHAYAKSIDSYANDWFDLVVVDGRVRHSCIAHSLKKIKTGGCLLLDNADRAYYLQPFPELFNQEKWRELTFVGHFPFGPASVLNTTKLFMKLPSR